MELIYLTRAGLAKLQRDLDNLMKVERPECVTQLATAREHGDLSENAEYDAARDQLANIDRKIMEVQSQLSRAQVIDESELNNDTVMILSKVKLFDLKRNKELTYTLVDALQSDPAKHLISVKSPVGKGLLGRKAGDEVTIQVPAGEIRYRILSIERAEGI